MQHPLPPQRDLAVGAHITKQGGIWLFIQAAGKHSAADVRPHKGVHAGGQIGPFAQDFRPFPKELIRLKRRPGQGKGGSARQQIQHGGVAGDDQGFYLSVRDTRFFTGIGQQLPDRVLRQALQPGKPAFQRRANAAHHIRRHNSLGVGLGGAGQVPACCQVKQF